MNLTALAFSCCLQIADVVLVDNENVLVESELRARGLVRLVGYSVQSFDGTPLGKVRDAAARPAWLAYVCQVNTSIFLNWLAS